MKYENMSFHFRLPEFENGDIFIDCNLSQVFPNTNLKNENKKIKFIRCNLTNCLLNENCKVEDSNNNQISICKFLMPHLENLPDEDENCEHVIMTKVVDNKNVYIRENKKV